MDTFSLGSLWMNAPWAVKLTAVVLFVLSIAVWSVIVIKAREQAALKKLLAEAEDALVTMEGFGETDVGLLAGGPDSPVSRLAGTAEGALAAYPNVKAHIGLPQWLTEQLRGAIDRESARLTNGLTLLSTTGVLSPFIGLFGTVIGIYHALTSLAASETVSVAALAGPAGESLLMTAFGLAVAIPAVFAYNVFLRKNRQTAEFLNRYARALYNAQLRKAGN